MHATDGVGVIVRESRGGGGSMDDIEVSTKEMRVACDDGDMTMMMMMMIIQTWLQ